MFDDDTPHTPPPRSKILKPYTSPDPKTLGMVIAAGGKNIISGIPSGMQSSHSLAVSHHLVQHSSIQTAMNMT